MFGSHVVTTPRVDPIYRCTKCLDFTDLLGPGTYVTRESFVTIAPVTERDDRPRVSSLHGLCLRFERYYVRLKRKLQEGDSHLKHYPLTKRTSPLPPHPTPRLLDDENKGKT